MQYFWDSGISIPILEQSTQSVTAGDGKTQKAKLEVIRNLARCFALLSLNGKYKCLFLHFYYYLCIVD